MKRQPVITGLGIVSPIGIGVEKFWEAALAGRSGIGRPTLFDGSKLPAECRNRWRGSGLQPACMDELSRG
jgi:3-oxoacyl-(acyl-carrier-protein) synthase